MNALHRRRPTPHAARRRTTPRSRTTAAVAALTVPLLLGLSACAGSDDAPRTDPSSTSAGEPATGGTLRFALGASPQGVDPQQVGSNVSIYIARQLADSLTDQDPETGEIVPWLAESWTVNDALTEFTFVLRDDVTFSDGTPLTAETVKTNFDALTGSLAPSAALASSYLTGYVETRVDDPHTVTVVFAEPTAQFLQATSTVSLAILSDATATVDPQKRLQGEIVGSGPFVLDSYTQDQGATILRRDGYAWASETFENRGEAYLDGIEFSIVPESGVRAGGLASGQFDAVGDVLTQDTPQIEAAGGSLLIRANPGISFILQPNVSRGGPLADQAVRAALQVAVNRQEIVDTVLSEAFPPATSVLASTTPGYVDLSDELAFDPDAAIEQLEDAGWVEGGDGIREKDGVRLSFDVVFSPVFTGNQAVLELVQQQLRAVGADLVLRQLTTPESTEAQKTGDYDTFYYNVTRADGDILRTNFATTLRNLNRRPADQVLDPLLDEQLSAVDAGARDEILADAQREIIAQGFAIPLFELSQSIGVAGDVHGLGFDASSRLTFHDTWIG